MSPARGIVVVSDHVEMVDADPGEDARLDTLTTWIAALTGDDARGDTIEALLRDPDKRMDTLGAAFYHLTDAEHQALTMTARVLRLEDQLGWTQQQR